ncbi:MAG: short chain dehydrogenase [Rhodobacter sp.]|nr:short chain dehydrogenase [Rhodobacter sp.]
MTALVTGAGKRLGRAMALYLAGRGHDLALHYASSRDEAEAVATEIRAMGRKAQTFQANLLVEAETEALIPAATEALGPLTVLVNNASIFEYDRIDTATRESWDRHIESNLRAPYVLTQAFARQCPPALMDENAEPLAQGLIVNMIDQRILKLTPEFSSYTIAKMGLWALTRTAAQGLAPHVRVNAIGPGPALQGTRQSADHFARQRAATVLGRGANPSDITVALGFFLDSPAVTGQFLAIDGGQHLAWQTPDVLGVE